MHWITESFDLHHTGTSPQRLFANPDPACEDVLDLWKFSYYIMNRDYNGSCNLMIYKQTAFISHGNKIPNGDECKPRSPFSALCGAPTNVLRLLLWNYSVFRPSAIDLRWCIHSCNRIWWVLANSLDGDERRINNWGSSVPFRACDCVCEGGRAVAAGTESDFRSIKLHVTLARRPYKVIIVFLFHCGRNSSPDSEYKWGTWKI